MPRFNSTTVGELREMLEGLDEDKLITFASDYGDYSRTQQVHVIRGDVEELPIRESAYSVSGWALGYDDEDEEDEEAMNNAPMVYVIHTYSRR